MFIVYSHVQDTEISERYRLKRNIKWLESMLKYVGRLTRGNTYLEECFKGKDRTLLLSHGLVWEISKFSLKRISWLKY
jgi:hypothetical protein